MVIEVDLNMILVILEAQILVDRQLSVQYAQMSPAARGVLGRRLRQGRAR